MIAQTIQLALAPVFVLVAIGNIMNVLSSRLGRVVDRSRKLRDLYNTTSGHEHDLVVTEIRLVARRIRHILRALLLLVLSGITVALTVGILFIEEMAEIELSRVAAAALRIPRDYLELERDL
jgi:hypothetical protein